MDTADTPLMQMLSTQMRYMSQRQGVIAQNIANTDTPGYQAKDLKKLDFSTMMSGSSGGSLAMRSTSAKHLQGTISGGSSFAAMNSKDGGEIKPVGNNVVLEDEMAKISDIGAQFQIASSLLKKFTGMYRSSLGK